MKPFASIPTRVDSRPGTCELGRRTLSTNELRSYLDTLGDDRSGVALRVALLTGGQRMAQLLRAKVGDFNKDSGTLRLWDGKGKRASPREHLIPMGPKAEAIVMSMVEQRDSTEEFIFEASERDAGQRVSEIAKAMNGELFDLRDIRRTCETMLAGLGIHKDTRAQVLSHGLSGVQSSHYDLHDYIDEKNNALAAWEARLDEITSGKQYNNILKITRNMYD